MKDTTDLYKDINGNGIKQLDVFIDRYTLLLGIHVKYIIFILLLLILYMLSDTDFFCRHSFFHAIDCQCNSGAVCYKSTECACIRFNQNIRIVTITVILIIFCIIKWIYACQMKPMVTACFQVFTRLEIYTYHKHKSERLHEKKRELEQEKMKSEFYYAELKRQINEYHENGKPEKTQGKGLFDKLNSHCLKIVLLSKELDDLSVAIERTENEMHGYKYEIDSYGSEIENAISSFVSKKKRNIVCEPDRIRIRMLFKSLGAQLLYTVEP